MSRLGKPGGSILPPDRRAPERALPVMIALLTVIAALLVATALSLSALRKGFGDDAGTMTLALTAPDTAEREAETDRVVERLQATAGVAAARRVPTAEVEHLVAPWLGARADQAVPLPALIDVTPVAPTQDLTAAAKAVAPQAIVARHGEVAQSIGATTRILGLAAITGAVAIVAICGWLVRSAAAARVSRQREAIALAQALGAEDRQIVWPIVSRAIGTAAVGLAAGSAAALAVLFGLGAEVSALLGPIAATGRAVTATAVAAIAVGGASFLAAWWTALSALGRR